MARSVSLICLALVAQVFSTPVPPVPEKYFGSYESVPENDQNFAEFASFFNLPPTVSLTKPNTLFFRPDGEYYTTTIVFSPYVPEFTQRFKLGEPETITVLGKTWEVVHTGELQGDNYVLKSKFRETTTDVKWTVDATFTPTGINAVYTREGVTSRRTYTRVPYPGVAGYYENVPEKQSPNFIEFANRAIPSPKGLTWDSNTGLWLGRYGNDYVVKYFVTPSVRVAFPFKFNEPRTIELNGRKITYKYTPVSENPREKTTTVRGEFTSEQGTLTLTATFSPEGVHTTYKTGDSTASRFYRRVLNPLVYGTYENVPEASENWAPFAAATGKPDDSAQRTRVQYYYANGQPYFRIAYENGQTFFHPFTLNKTYEATFHGQNPVKFTFNERPSYSNDVILTNTYEVNGKPFKAEMTFNTTGIKTTFRYEGQVATRYYRRVIPAVALGKFESTPDTPEFAQFAQTIGSPELVKKTTVELTQTPEYTYTQTLTVEGTPGPVTFPFTLGEKNTTPLKGQPVNYTYLLFTYPNPVLTTYWWGPTFNFTVSAEFTPTGYTATYIAGGRLATRTYTRVGAPVPLETYPTA